VICGRFNTTAGVALVSNDKGFFVPNEENQLRDGQSW
jgi:hypothetical protein